MIVHTTVGATFPEIWLNLLLLLSTIQIDCFYLLCMKIKPNSNLAEQPLAVAEKTITITITTSQKKVVRIKPLDNVQLSTLWQKRSVSFAFSFSFEVIRM